MWNRDCFAAELVCELDADGKQLRSVKLTDYTAEKVRTLCASPDEQAVPAPNGGRAQAPERGIDFPAAAAQVIKPEVDPFDLLCHLALNAPVLTEITGKFGGADQLRTAVNQLQSLLYAA